MATPSSESCRLDAALPDATPSGSSMRWMSNLPMRRSATYTKCCWLKRTRCYHCRVQEIPPPPAMPTVKAITADAGNRQPKGNVCKSWGSEGGCCFVQPCKLSMRTCQGQESVLLDVQLIVAQEG